MEEKEQEEKKQPVEGGQIVAFPFEMFMTKTISTSLGHETLLKEIAEFRGDKKIDPLRREAIELLYQKVFPNSKI